MFGLPASWLVGTALLRKPGTVLVLGGLFAGSVWWFVKATRPAPQHLPPPPASTIVPTAQREADVPPAPDTLGWVAWRSVTGRASRARPVHVDSPRSKGACIDALARLMPPIETDLRFTKHLTRSSPDRWMDVDDDTDRARLSLHISGVAFPRVASSAGADGWIRPSSGGCAIDVWVRPSQLNHLSAIATGIVYAGFSSVVLITAALNAASGWVSAALGGTTIAAVLAGVGVAAMRAERRLAARLVDDLVAALEQASASTAVTPSSTGDLPVPPVHVMTSTERAVHTANTQVRIGPSSGSAGCLPTGAVIASAVLLIVGSITALG